MTNTLPIIQSSLRKDIPPFASGDIIKVHQRIKEGDKERLITFEGLVIAKKHGQGITGTFTVRKVVDGIGVERIFPLHAPTIIKIDIISRAGARGAKLYYVREKAAREVRRKMKTLRAEAEEKKTTEIEVADESVKTAE